jgi:L-asparaginase II
MPNEDAASPIPADNPVVVEVTRGDMVESRHRAAYAVCDGEGRVILSGGDTQCPVYARSALKPVQAIALVETGAAEAFALGDGEIALACASHAGEPRHVETVAAWLTRLGLSESDLECGPQLPTHEASAEHLLRAGDKPNQLHNNCSGKHAGFLTVARHLGWEPKDYIRLEHPVQQRLLGILESMTGLDLSDAAKGIDGCGIPVIGVPLGNLALAMARFADPYDQPEGRQTAVRRIAQAMAAEPFMVAGSGRFCTEVMQATAGRALVKTGAEGVYCGALPAEGLGIALKVDDGATRAAENLMARLLSRLGVLDEATLARLSARLERPLFNRAGRKVGVVRRATENPF